MLKFEALTLTQVMETAVSRKKRMLLAQRELEAQRASGPASSRGFLRALVSSVTRGSDRCPADTIAALKAEVSFRPLCNGWRLRVPCFGAGSCLGHVPGAGRLAVAAGTPVDMLDLQHPA